MADQDTDPVQYSRAWETVAEAFVAPADRDEAQLVLLELGLANSRAHSGLRITSADPSGSRVYSPRLLSLVRREIAARRAPPETRDDEIAEDELVALGVNVDPRLRPVGAADVLRLVEYTRALAQSGAIDDGRAETALDVARRVELALRRDLVSGR